MAKYCKEYRCRVNDGTPCPSADDCFLFRWDIDREKGTKQTVGNPLESQEQEEFAAWCDAKGLLWAHIPNERKATVRVLGELEKQGLKKGFPDNFIAEPNKKYHGLFIELKRAKKHLSRVSREQREWIKELNKKGYAAYVCYGAEEAKRVVLAYLDCPPKNKDVGEECKTLHNVVNWIVRDCCEDICKLCANLSTSEWEFEGDIPEDVEPCKHRREHGDEACRKGIIEYFRRKK